MRAPVAHRESDANRRIRHLYFAQHLTNDHFNVLIVNGYTLKAVNLLDFINDVLTSSSTPFRRKMSWALKGPSQPFRLSLLARRRIHQWFATLESVFLLDRHQRV